MADKYRDPKERGGKKRSRVVRYRTMASLVDTQPLADEEFAEIVAQHREFVDSGGGGGSWHTFATGGLGTGVVIGVYVGQEGKETAGAQAQLAHRRLDGLNLRGVQLPFADLCGVSCRGQDLRGANMSGSLLTDADFSGSDFQGASLAGADFSRSDLMRCSFRDADLTHADFENADLTGADLRGATLEGARFAGAAMESVQQ